MMCSSSLHRNRSDAGTTVRGVVRAFAPVVLAACTSQTFPSTSPPPPPSGFGEPLSPGPYAFFPDHSDDWDGIIGRVGAITRALPDLRWLMCDVRSPASRRTAADHVRALANLSHRLKSAGVVPRIEAGPAACLTQVRGMDLFYLMPITAD